MHRLLRISEILDNVAEHVHGDPDRHPFVNDALSMGLVCRTFHEAAMNRIWYLLPSLLPLFRCLPADVVSLSKDEVLDRESAGTSGTQKIGSFVRSAILVPIPLLIIIGHVGSPPSSAR